MSTRIKDPGRAAAAGRIAERVCQSNNPPAAHGDDGVDAYSITSPTHPSDPAVAAIAAGRVVAERIAQSSNPRRRRGRPQNPRAPPDDLFDDDDGADAFGIPEFCRRHHISESFYFKLQALGLGPTTMRIGRRVLISAEEAARWRAERTAASKRSSTPLIGTSPSNDAA
jgi:hypothetical protein